MGLLLGLGLLAAAAVPDAYRSCKVKMNSDLDDIVFGYSNNRARDIVDDIMSGTRVCFKTIKLTKAKCKREKQPHGSRRLFSHTA